MGLPLTDRHAAPDAHDLHDDGVMEDLVEWVAAIAYNELLPLMGEDAARVHADNIGGSFTDLLVNHYGED